MFGVWQSRLQLLKIEVHALWLAYRDPRVPWYAKLMAACVLAYALSPIDLIPDFIPIVGHLDDIILVPAGLFLAFKLVPDNVFEECRHTATATADRPSGLGSVGAAVVVAVWIAVAVLIVWLASHAGSR